jgi:hypothetical protein
MPAFVPNFSRVENNHVIYLPCSLLALAGRESESLLFVSRKQASEYKSEKGGRKKQK